MGTGDPELMTLKAVKRILSCEVIAIPHGEKDRCTAYRIARQAAPEIEQKECICLPMPMTKEKGVLEESHDRAARRVAAYLDQGKDVGFLTLGDVSLYSTFHYLMDRLSEKGYTVSLECGIPSFCAAAAKLLTPLVTGSEQLHIIPASYQIREALKLPGAKVLMKAGRQMKAVKEELKRLGASVVMVENCGMEEEKVFYSLEEIPDEAGYYSLLIVR